MRRATLGQELVEFLTQSQASQRIFVGCLALLVHDWFLTFGDEVAYIWRSDWRIPKILFLLNRYPVIANAVLQVTYTMMISATNLSNCEMLLKAIISMKFAGIIVSEVILFLKVLSLYRNSHAVYATLGLFASFCMISAVIVIIIWADSVRWTSTPLHLFQGCIPQASMAIIADVWIMVVWEILIVGMAIYKSYRTWRESTSSLFGVLYKDGIHYFGLALASSVANLALSLAIPNNFILSHVLFGPVSAIHSIIASRILFHVRAVPQLPSPPLQLRPSSFQPIDLPDIIIEDRFQDNIHLSTLTSPSSSFSDSDTPARRLSTLFEEQEWGANLVPEPPRGLNKGY